MNLSTIYKKLTNRKYTIGYKFILSLFIGFIGSISFGYGDTINNIDLSIGSAQTKSASCNGFCCFSSYSSYTYLRYTQINYGNISNYLLFSGVNNSYPLTCLEINGNFSIYNGGGSNIHVLYWDMSDFVPSSSCPDCPTCPTCPDCPTCSENICRMTVTQNGVIDSYYYTGEEGSFTIYLDDNISYSSGLSYGGSPNISVSPICINTGGCVESSGLEWSALYINNIQYPGAPTIKFTIPEEIERDQNTDEEEINIDVIGYGYDQDKMQQMVNTQYYKPTAEEMSGLMEKVADFLPLVAVALLIIRIRRIIKKIF